MPGLNDAMTLKGLRLRNRLVMAPMVTGLAEDHRVGERLLAWYAQRARAGMGLVIVEACCIAEDATILPATLGIWDDAFIPGLGRLAQAIQREGAPAVLQLVHGGARSVRADTTEERIGPSAVPVLPGPPPRPMTEVEILRTIEAFAAAAARAQAAGFAGIELHAAHYYLLSEFLSPRTNLRTDRWGGSLEGRSRIVVETIRAVRRTVGPDFPVLCRMHAVEAVEGGLETEDARAMARGFVKAGVDAIHASGIGQSSMVEWEGRAFLSTSSVLPRDAAPGTFAAHAARLREGLGAPVIAVGKLAADGAAAKALKEGWADLVAIGRQLIADPQTGTKLLEGRDADIRRCQECLACFAAIRKGPIACTVNLDL